MSTAYQNPKLKNLSAEISACYQCPYCIRNQNRYKCSVEEKIIIETTNDNKIEEKLGQLPDWCPLPDYDEKVYYINSKTSIQHILEIINKIIKCLNNQKEIVLTVKDLN